MPNLNASIRVQHKHEPNMRAVRVNVLCAELSNLIVFNFYFINKS